MNVSDDQRRYEGVGPRSEGLNEAARDLFPGGVSSPVRAFKGVGGEPPVIRRAMGALLTDVDGRIYVDLIGSWGPMVVGHGHPEVVKAVQERIKRGVSTGTPSPDEVRLGHRIRALIPYMEKLRFVVSGTEACMSALRLARAATKRTKLIKFEGCYHGHADPFLASAGSGALTLGTPDSPGVPADVVKDTISVPYNDLDAVKAAFEANDGEIAAVFVEPVAGNMGVIPPVEGFLPGLRGLCTQHGALLVFDEVMTGFRVNRCTAGELYEVTPDLTTLGKAIGGGFPVAAYGGQKDLMSMVAPEGPVYQAGTLAGNPVAMTAGIATLRALTRPGIWERVREQAVKLAGGLEDGARAAGVSAVAARVGTMLSLWFADKAPRNLEEAKATDTEAFKRYHAAMLRHGVHLPPSPFEAWFVGLAHNDVVIDRILEAHNRAVAQT